MRSWRNWQTRTVQVRVGDHGGSNPFDRTIAKETSFRVSLLLYIQSGDSNPKGRSRHKNIFSKIIKKHLQILCKNSRINKSKKNRYAVVAELADAQD